MAQSLLISLPAELVTDRIAKYLDDYSLHNLRATCRDMDSKTTKEFIARHLEHVRVALTVDYLQEAIQMLQCQAFANGVRKIELLDPHRARAPFTPLQQKDLDVIFDLVKKLLSKLTGIEYFDIETVTQNGHVPRSQAVPGPRSPLAVQALRAANDALHAKVKTFYLIGGNFQHGDIHRFLTNHRTTLETVFFKTIWISNVNWPDMFQYMRDHMSVSRFNFSCMSSSSNLYDRLLNRDDHMDTEVKRRVYDAKWDDEFVGVLIERDGGFMDTRDGVKAGLNIVLKLQPSPLFDPSLPH